MQKFGKFSDIAGNRGEGITVAMLDTGIEIQHPAFSNVSVIAEDFCAGQAGVDADGHGTQCCGVIAQVAPACTLLAGRTLVQSGSFSSDALFSGLLWAARNGANIICVCTGERIHDPDLEEIIDRFAEEGRIVVAAVGNTGRQGPGAGLFPARYRKSLAIGSAEDDGTLSSFTDLPADKDVICPRGNNFLAPSLGGSHQEVTGTSMSAAWMAGLVALKLAQRKSVQQKSIQQILIENCDLRQSDRGAYRLLDVARLFSQAC